MRLLRPVALIALALALMGCKIGELFGSYRAPLRHCRVGAWYQSNAAPPTVTIVWREDSGAVCDSLLAKDGVP